MECQCPNLNVCIQQSSIVGRYLLANKEFEPGDQIFEDDPGLAGPGHKTEPVCINCLQILQNQMHSSCSICGSPLCTRCSSEVQSSQVNFHSKDECNILRHLVVKKETSQFPFKTILPLRLSLEASKGSKIWKSLELLTDHQEERRQNQEEWQMFDTEVVEYLLNGFFQEKIFITSELVHKCIGIICVNSVSFDLKISQGARRKGRILFPLASLASHNCVNNSAYTINPESLRLTLKARCKISKGDEVTISYVPMVIGRPLRDRHIQDEWFFECSCQRCKDPTDNRSYISAILCQHCAKTGSISGDKPGFLLPSADSWTCDLCGASTPSKSVQTLVSEIESELRVICSCGSNQMHFQDFIAKYTSKLHQNHFLLLIAKRNLISLLHKNYLHLLENKKTQNQTDVDDQIEEKALNILKARLKLSREILIVIKQLDPNYSEWLGFVLNDLVSALSLLRKKIKNFKPELVPMLAIWMRDAQMCNKIFGQSF